MFVIRIELFSFYTNYMVISACICYNGIAQSFSLRCVRTGEKKALCRRQSFRKERDDCMRKELKVEDLNRMNDVFAKYIFANEARKKERRQLAMVDADIRTAMEAEKEFVQDYEYISAYDRQEKYERDRMAREDFVREEGEAIGEARGIAMGIAKAVNALRNKGKSDAAIAELLDMDVKEVQLIQ